MSEQTLDVKTEAVSSPASDVKGTESSSVQTEASTQTTDVKQPDLQAIATKIFEKHEAAKAESSTDATEDKAEESKSQKDIDIANEAKPEVEEDKEDSEATAQTEEAKHEEAVPYKRFDEVNTELKQVKEVVEKELKPKAEIYDQWIGALTKGNVDEGDFKFTVETLCLVDSNPQEALSRVEAFAAKLRDAVGQGALPTDLQSQIEGIDQEVTDGTLTKDRADQLKNSVREIAKLRGQSKFTEKRSQQSVANAQQQAAQVAINSAVTALGSWTQSTAASDPDFQKDSPKYKYFFALYEKSLTNFGRIPSPTETIKLAKDLKTEVDSTFKKLIPTVSKAKGLSSTKSSDTKAAPTTLQGKVDAILAKKGVKFV